MAGQKKQKKPKVLVLFCGGTLVMEEDKNGTLLPTSKERAIEILLGMEPRLRERIDMDVTYIDNIDSTNMRPEHWDKMADVIGRRQARSRTRYKISASPLSLQGPKCREARWKRMRAATS